MNKRSLLSGNKRRLSLPDSNSVESPV